MANITTPNPDTDAISVLPDAPMSTSSQIGDVEIAGHHYITADRLAEMLGVTVRTLARWNAQRVGPPKISIGKTVLFDLAKLPEWLATHEVHPTRNTSH